MSDMFENFTVKIGRDQGGRLYVTSPEIKGLLTSGRDVNEAMRNAARAIEELHAAYEAPQPSVP